jgi:hypothetical protein
VSTVTAEVEAAAAAGVSGMRKSGGLHCQQEAHQQHAARTRTRRTNEFEITQAGVCAAPPHARPVYMLLTCEVVHAGVTAAEATVRCDGV